MSYSHLLKDRVLEHFNALCKIPRGSGNMEKISQYCVDFANKNNLRVLRDKANNVIIYKAASKGYENADTVILQAHLDMVCQKTKDCNINFETDGIESYIDNGFVKARGTTLGADDGIGVSYILTILESDSIEHPAIEAVLTADEEIGMLGAHALDTSVLQGKMLIGLDSGREEILTVSCAGGEELIADVPIDRKETKGTLVTVDIGGLKGGHSGAEIDKGRENANILAGRFLKQMQSLAEFELVSIDGGDKSNAITAACCIKICTPVPDEFVSRAADCIKALKADVYKTEPDFFATVSIGQSKTHLCFSTKQKEDVIALINSLPYGVIRMSEEIEGLVETSLNFGILKTMENSIHFNFSVRSNKSNSLKSTVSTLSELLEDIPCNIKKSGFYPPWEYKENTVLQQLYTVCFVDLFNKMPKVRAIHAGLECGIFSSKIPNLDCIEMGPQLYEIHTVNERMDIASVGRIFELVINILKRLKA